jgi:hypothetical protein
MQELKYRMLADKQSLEPIMEMMREQVAATVTQLSEEDKRIMKTYGEDESPKRWA